VNSDRFLTYSLSNKALTRILSAAIDSVEPGRIVRQYLENTKLPVYDRLFLLGIGKAAEPMTTAAALLLDPFEEALIVTKQSLGTVQQIPSNKIRDRITIMEAGHPVPDERSLAAGQAVLEFVSRLNYNDLLICLISGGGSALVAVPESGLSIEDTQLLTSSMLSLGANIDELNLLRRQIDHLKGGGLVAATKAKIMSLILSDVMGDNLATIASGMTVPNIMDKNKLLAVLKRYQVADHVSTNILNIIMSDKKSEFTQLDRVQNIIVANNKLAANAAKEQAQKEGFTTEIINTNLYGEARLVGNQLATTLQNTIQLMQHPFCLISGGETTVTLRGDGKGGRNQELALAAVEILDSLQNVMFITLATDGNDGPTDAAGAVVTGETYRRSKELGMIPAQFLSRNDSYHYFALLDDLLRPGYTGTNVNDLIFLFGL
jgi:hydroxypyruvate reductase